LQPYSSAFATVHAFDSPCHHRKLAMTMGVNGSIIAFQRKDGWGTSLLPGSVWFGQADMASALIQL